MVLGEGVPPLPVGAGPTPVGPVPPGDQPEAPHLELRQVPLRQQQCRGLPYLDRGPEVVPRHLGRRPVTAVREGDLQELQSVEVPSEPLAGPRPSPRSRPQVADEPRPRVPGIAVEVDRGLAAWVGLGPVTKWHGAQSRQAAAGADRDAPLAPLSSRRPRCAGGRPSPTRGVGDQLK